MNIDSTTADVIHLLHEAAFGTLATHSASVAGYPFASVLQFAPDEHHRPVFLISHLAEHWHNLRKDKRASLVVHRPGKKGVPDGERVTLIGDAEPVDAGPLLIARYLRYHPQAEQFLRLEGFSFFRLVPRRARYIGGFGMVGWIEGAELAGAPSLPPAAERSLVNRLARCQQPGVRLLGLDCYGMDMERRGRRTRRYFPGSPWLLERIEKDAMQQPEPPEPVDPPS